MFIRMRDSHSRSVAKAVSWRIVGSIDTLVLSFIFTGSVKLAGSIASTEMLTKVALYYFHERAWSRIGRALPSPSIEDGSATGKVEPGGAASGQE
jgi:uncharacterized membrane protein